MFVFIKCSLFRSVSQCECASMSEWTSILYICLPACWVVWPAADLIFLLLLRAFRESRFSLSHIFLGSIHADGICWEASSSSNTETWRRRRRWLNEPWFLWTYDAPVTRNPLVLRTACGSSTSEDLHPLFYVLTQKLIMFLLMSVCSFVLVTIK